MIRDGESEKLGASPEYRAWLQVARGSVVALALLDKFCSFGDTDNDGDDDGFEDEECEDMEDDGKVDDQIGQQNESVIDLDKLREFGWQFL